MPTLIKWFSAALSQSLLLGGCGLPGAFSGELPYHNDDYGFTITLPAGWAMDVGSSKSLTEEMRREHKDAMAAWFTPSNNAVDPFGLNLMIVFTPSNLEIPIAERQKQSLEELKSTFNGRPGDQIYGMNALMLSDQPSAQVIICTAYGSAHGCKIVHHVTELLAQHGTIRIQFNIFAELYQKYQSRIERSLASIRVEATPPPTPTAKCQSSDIQVIKHDWVRGGTFGPSVSLVWMATLKNIGPSRCMVSVGYQFLDQDGTVLSDDSTQPKSIDPQQTVELANTVESFELTLLPRLHSSRVVIISVE